MSIRIKAGLVMLGILLFAGAFFYAKFSKQSAGENKNDSEEYVSQAQLAIESPYINPLPNPLERITKKPFGIKVSPSDSPVRPERFSGYHTGVDLEIVEGELNRDINVKALCDGKLRSKRSASGYGGLVVQDCTIEGNPVTIIYGHLRLSSINKAVGDNIAAGETVGILGNDKSNETGGERKHLHLGIHKGNQIQILGYVQNKGQLENWIDPAKYLTDRNNDNK